MPILVSDRLRAASWHRNFRPAAGPSPARPLPALRRHHWSSTPRSRLADPNTFCIILRAIPNRANLSARRSRSLQRDPDARPHSHPGHRRNRRRIAGRHRAASLATRRTPNAAARRRRNGHLPPGASSSANIRVRRLESPPAHAPATLSITSSRLSAEASTRRAICNGSPSPKPRPRTASNKRQLRDHGQSRLNWIGATAASPA